MPKAKFATLINSLRGLCCCSLGNEDEAESHYERRHEEVSAARKYSIPKGVVQIYDGANDAGTVVPQSLTFSNLKYDHTFRQEGIPSDNIVNIKPDRKKQFSYQDNRNRSDTGAVKKNIQIENIVVSRDTVNKQATFISNVCTDFTNKRVRETDNFPSRKYDRSPYFQSDIPRVNVVNSKPDITLIRKEFSYQDDRNRNDTRAVKKYIQNENILFRDPVKKQTNFENFILEDMLYDDWNTRMRESGIIVNIYKSTSNRFPYPPPTPLYSRDNVEANTYWYHGTDYESAVSILKEIILEKGKPRQDFSHKDGFYLSPDFEGAKRLAFGKKTKGIPAILIFKRGFNLQMYSGLKLQFESEWETIIKYNRSGRNLDLCDLSHKLLDKFSNSDYILGPVNTDGPCPKVENIQNYRTWKVNGYKMKYRQLCIRGTKLAAVFGDDIESVIVYPNKQMTPIL